MNSPRILVELKDNLEDQAIVNEVLQNAGIRISHLSQGNFTNQHPKIDIRTGINNLPLSTLTKETLIKNDMSRLSDIITSFKDEFKNIKKLSSEIKEELHIFIADIFLIKKTNFIPFLSMRKNVSKALLKSNIFDISIIKKMNFEEISKINGNRQSLTCDMLLYLARVASPYHFDTIVGESFKDENTSSKRQQRQLTEYGGKLKVHGRTSTKNLEIDNSIKDWLLENNYSTLFSIIFEYESNFSKIKEKEFSDKFLCNKIISEIKKYIHNISNIENEMYTTINQNISSVSKNTLLKNKVYDLSKLDKEKLQDILSHIDDDKKELIIMEVTENLSSLLQKRISKNEKNNEKVKKHEEESTEKKSFAKLSESDSESNKERRNSELKILPSISSQKESKLESTKKEEVEVKSNNVSSFPISNASVNEGVYAIECLNLEDSVITILHNNGIASVLDIQQNESKFFRTKGINKEQKSQIMEQILEFSSGNKDFDVKYLAHSIRDLELPYNIELALIKEKFFFIESLLNKSEEDLRSIKNIGNVSAELVHEKIRKVEGCCNLKFLHDKGL